GDGLIATSGKASELYETVLAKVAEGATEAGKDPASLPRQIEIKVSYDSDLEYARQACTWWAALGLSPDQKQGVEDPVEMERLADEDPLIATKRFIVTNDPDEVVDRVQRYVDLGFTELVFHGPGEDQARFLNNFTRDVLPRLRKRYG